MSWLNVWGHDRAAFSFAVAEKRRRLGGSYLFVGSQGIGKRTFAFMLGQTLLCQNRRSVGLDINSDSGESLSDVLTSFVPCGECPSCKTFSSFLDENVSDNVETSVSSGSKLVLPSNPDFLYICKPEDKSLLPLELLAGEKENRGKAGLCYEISRAPFFGIRKFAIIDDADYFNQEGANALLKTLEEPPPNAMIILLGTSAAKQLPTIRSRCRLIRFFPLNPEDMKSILLFRHLASSEEEAQRLAQISDGRVSAVLERRQESLEKFRLILYQELSKPVPEAIFFAQRVNEFVESAGKDAILRRGRLRFILTEALEFYRRLIQYQEGCSSLPGVSAEVQTIFYQALRQRQRDGSSPMTAVRAAERTLSALDQLEKNANIPLIAESWLDDLIYRILIY